MIKDWRGQMDIGEALRGAISRFMGRASHDKEAVEELIRDVQRALLTGDVNVELVMQLSDNIRRKVAETKPPPGVSRRDHVFKILYEELVRLLGGVQRPYKPRGKPHVLMVVGIQGSGKTTSVAKLSNYLAKDGYRVGVICADTYRPAALTQLQQLLSDKGITVYGEENTRDPIEIVRRGLEKLKAQALDIVIIDTAGRHKDQDSLMKEMDEIQAAVKPDEVALVLDATIGQRAKSQAEAFNRVAKIGWVLLTKTDTSARAGGALSAVAVTGAPIRFIGTGEHLEDIETFSADRYLARLLGMPDLAGLVERVRLAEMKISEEEAEKMISGRFTLVDMINQLKEVSKMGPLDKLLSMLPLSKAKPIDIEEVQGQVKRWEAIVNSMTHEERRDPSIIDSSRAKRIARGAGVMERDVKQLIKRYNETKKMMRALKRSMGRVPKDLILSGLMRRGVGREALED
ncbi:MAG: signal recognition particle receptor subunit alpha [Nitrososphaerota archaeon]